LLWVDQVKKAFPQFKGNEKGENEKGVNSLVPVEKHLLRHCEESAVVRRRRNEAISNSLIYTNARLILRLRRIAKTAMRLFKQAVWT
jgi:hypothetical protein